MATHRRRSGTAATVLVGITVGASGAVAGGRSITLLQQGAVSTDSNRLPQRAVDMAYGDAAPILAALRSDLLPLELTSASDARMEAWPRWVAERNARIRSRLREGDEDSVLNIILLGESFTRQARLTELADLRMAGKPRELFDRRVDELIAALNSTSSDERLEFVRSVVSAAGVEVRDAASVRSYFVGILERVIRETEAYARDVAAMHAATDAVTKLSIDAGLYRQRGLSSDTSLVSGFAIRQALAAMADNGAVERGSIRRAAVVGPGLDILDRRDGRDLAPIQTIQPFAVVDALIDLGLTPDGDLRLTTFDISPRVNAHIDEARRRAETGQGYILRLPFDPRLFTAEVERYWDRFGVSSSDRRMVAAPTARAGAVALKTVPVRPEIVRAIEPRDLNIVLQRLELAPEERFDLVVATNVLIYYDVFERSLAVANLARMLRPGGMLLSNTLISELPGLPISLAGFADVVYTPTALGDRLLWYRRD